MDVFLVVVIGLMVFIVIGLIYAIIRLAIQEWKLTIFFIFLALIPIGLLVSIFDRTMSNYLVGAGIVICVIWLIARFKGNF